MRKHCLGSQGVLVAICVLGSISPAWAGSLFLKSKTITATGMADIQGGDVVKARELAIRRAQRAAIEEAVGIMVASSFTAEQKEVVKGNESVFSSEVEERIYTESTGFVERQRIVKEKKTNNAVEVVVEVTVKEKSLQEELTVLDAILRDAGYPKVALLVRESYRDAKGTQVTIERPASQSHIEGALTGRRIEMMSKGALEKMTAQPKKLAALMGSDAELALLAKENGADVALVGDVRGVYSAHNELGQGMYYVSAAVSLRAVRGGTGKILANVEAVGRGVGVSEELARIDSIARAAPKVAGKLLDALVLTWSTEKERKGETYAVTLSGVTPKKRFLQGLVRAVRAVAGISEINVAKPSGRKVEVAMTFAGSPSLLKSRLSDALRKQKKYRKVSVSVAPPQAPAPRTVALQRQRVPTETVSDGVLTEGADDPELALVPTPRAPGKEGGSDGGGARADSGAKQAVILRSGDSGVTGAVRALANEIVQRYEEKGDPAPFHRIAVPYLEQSGKAAADENLGRVVAELLSAELSKREPFVVVEREQLGRVMREHRLAGLGIVDPDTVADFGRILGAQSVISGSVAAVGAEFSVTVRQVSVRDGSVLAAASVPVDRAGLVALSSAAVVKRSKMGAVLRSALMPGFGQFYNDEPLKSALFLGLGFGALGTGLGYYVSGQRARADYEENIPETVPQGKVANDRYRVSNIMQIAFAVIWAASVTDAYFSGRDYTAVEVEPTPDGVQVRF